MEFNEDGEDWKKKFDEWKKKNDFPIYFKDFKENTIMMNYKMKEINLMCPNKENPMFFLNTDYDWQSDINSFVLSCSSANFNQIMGKVN